MTSKDTIDILNRKEFFYWHKPAKTPEVLEKDKEQTKRDFELIRKDLIALDIIKNKQIDVKDITDTTDDYELYQAYCIGKGYTEDYICSQDEFKLLREVLVDDK